MTTLFMIAVIASISMPAIMHAAKHETPLACDRSALSSEQRKRHFDERRAAFAVVEEEHA